MRLNLILDLKEVQLIVLEISRNESVSDTGCQNMIGEFMSILSTKALLAVHTESVRCQAREK